jgi:hypothetical protein
MLEDVNRRRLLTDVAGVAIAPVVASDLIAHGFHAALRDGPTVDEWQGTVDQYGADYMTEGAATIQQRLARDLVTLQAQLDRPAHWETAAKLATLYGKTFPGSDGTKAADWYEIAATAADRSENTASRVWVRGRAAIALGYEGAGLDLADRFARDAMALSEKPSIGRLNALIGAAHVAALRGARAAAYALLDSGRRVFERVASPTYPATDYAVPEWRMAVFTSLLAARLGDERLYDAARSDALAALPAALPRFRTHLELHRALVLARGGDKVGAVAAADEALAALPPERHSLTLRLLRSEVAA